MSKPKVSKGKPMDKQKPANSKWSTTTIRTIIYLILLSIVFIPVYNNSFDKKTALLGDNAAYYILGKALANGDGFVQANIKAKPKANHFPPGYPTFMAGVMKVFNDHIITLKIANGVLYWLSLIILFFFFRAISKNIHLSFVLTLVILFNMHLLQYASMTMSEIPFLFISSLALLLLTQVKWEKKPWADLWFWAMILSTAASYYTRGQGLAVFFGVMLFIAFEKKWLHLIIAGASYILLLLPWYLRNLGLAESSYAKALKLKNYYNPDEGLMQFGDWIDRFFVNMERYMKFEIPSSMFGYQANYQTDAKMLLGIISAILILFGIYKLKNYRMAIVGYLLATFGILFLWPEIWNGIRFILAIVPLLVFLFAYGIFQVFELIVDRLKLSKKFLNGNFAFLFIIMLFIYLPQMETLNKAAQKPMNPLFKNYFALAEWTQKNLPDTAVIVCRKPNLFYIYAHHYVDGFSKVSDMQGFLTTLDKKNATHIVVYGDGISQRYFMPVYQKNPEKFPVIQQFKNPDVWLLAYKPQQGYTGEWNGDIKEGQGSYLYPDGKKYIGQWKNDKMNGSGKLYDAQGNIIQEGQWIDGKFNATIINND